VVPDETDFSEGDSSARVELRFERPAYALALASESESRALEVIVLDPPGAGTFELREGGVIIFDAPALTVRVRQLVPSTRPATLIAAESCGAYPVLPLERVAVCRAPWITSTLESEEIEHHFFPFPTLRECISDMGFRGWLEANNADDLDLVLRWGRYVVVDGKVTAIGPTTEIAGEWDDGATLEMLEEGTSADGIYFEIEHTAAVNTDPITYGLRVDYGVVGPGLPLELEAP
jgi:hypothetical protein